MLIFKLQSNNIINEDSTKADLIVLGRQLCVAMYDFRNSPSNSD